MPLVSSSGSLISDFPIMKTIVIMPALGKLPLQCLHRLKLPTRRLGSGGGFSAVHTRASQWCLQISSTPPQQHKRFCSLPSLISARPKWQGPLREILISELYRSQAFMCRFVNAFLVLYLGITAFPKSGLTVLSGDSWQEGPMHCSLCISRLVSPKSNPWLLLRTRFPFLTSQLIHL